MPRKDASVSLAVADTASSGKARDSGTPKDSVLGSCTLATAVWAGTCVVLFFIAVYLKTSVSDLEGQVWLCQAARQRPMHPHRPDPCAHVTAAIASCCVGPVGLVSAPLC